MAYSGNQTVNVIKGLTCKGYAVTIEEKAGNQVVSVVFQGRTVSVFQDNMLGNSSDAVPIYGTAMTNMIDWYYDQEGKIE